jgi:hypothetical protein
MSAVIPIIAMVCLAGISFTCIAYMFFQKEQSSTAPTSQVAVITESEQNTVPFSYNVPVDSHVNYKNDVVIVVEHPDERVAIGMVPR